MVAHSPSQRLIFSPRAKVAGAGGGLVLLACILMPSGLFEGAVLASGIPAVLAAAEPPLGLTARLGLGGLLGGLLAAFLWIGLGLLDDDGAMGQAVLKRLRTRDAHPDAPRRAPLSASELGEPAPPPSPPPAPLVERDLPADLNQPLAAFDPAAIPPVPLAPPVTVAPLAPPQRPALIDPGDRIETFELTPFQRAPLAEPAFDAAAERAARPLSLRVPPSHALRTLTLRDTDAESLRAPLPIARPIAPEPMVAPATESSVHALLARLERGMNAAPPPPPAPPAPVAAPAGPSLRTGRVDDILGDLRRLATVR